MSWIYKNKKVSSLKQISELLGYTPYGFIYRITLQHEGQELIYFGQKTMQTDAKRIIGQRELKERGKKPFRKYKSKKGKKKGTWIYYEEGKSETWQTYDSSSDQVKELIAQGVPHRKEILEFTTQKSLLNWFEMRQIVCTGCLESEYCLNRRVGNYHARNIILALKKDELKKNV